MVFPFRHHVRMIGAFIRSRADEIVLAATCRCAAAAAFAIAAACSAAAASAGPPVGRHEWTLLIAGEETRATLWYPSTGAARAMADGPFAADVALDGPPASGVFPVVVLSHGSGGTPASYEPIAESLAEAGFVVAGVNHSGDTVGDTSRRGKADVFAMRPRQARALLDAVLADSEWGPRLDSERIGAVGHSAGGYTVLALAGAVPDIQLLAKHCAADYDRDGFCSYGGTPASRYAVIPPMPMPMEGLHDPRIKAVAALAPIGAFFTEDSLKRITVPVLLVTGKRDTVLPEQFHAVPLAAGLGEHVRWLSYDQVGHFSFIAPVGPAWKTRLSEIAQDPAGLDRAAFQKELAQELTDFFRKALGPAAAGNKAGNGR